MSIKTRVAVAGIITTTVLLFTYVSLRSGTIEGEYVKTLVAQSDRIAIAFAGHEKDRPRPPQPQPLPGGDEPRASQHGPSRHIRRFEHAAGGGKNDRYISDRRLFDEITGAFTRGEFAPRKNAAFIVRYFEQTKFYLFVKETPSGNLLVAFPYKLRGKLMVKLLLEIALIVILAVLFTTALYLYLIRRERPPLPRHEAAVVRETKSDRIRKAGEMTGRGRAPPRRRRWLPSRPAMRAPSYRSTSSMNRCPPPQTPRIRRRRALTPG